MIDYTEPCDVYEARERTARKSHRCCECRREIRSGERYEVARMLFEGQWSEFKTCEGCRWAAEWLVEHCGGTVHACLLEDLLEHYRGEYIREPQLVVRIAGMRRGWRGRMLERAKDRLRVTEEERV